MSSPRAGSPIMRRSPYGFDVLGTCTSCSWRTERFFCALPPDAVKALDSVASTNMFPAGSLLFSEGDPPRAVYVVCRGSVKLSIASGDGRTLITHIAHAGEALGLSSVFTTHEQKATAETLEPTQVKVVRREDFLRFVSEHAEACRKSCEQLASDCEAADDHIRSIGLSHSAAEKLAHLLLAWCAESGRPGDQGIRLQLLMTHHDISQLIGTSRETVTRLLREFRDREIISIKGSTLTVLDQAALDAMVD